MKIIKVNFIVFFIALSVISFNSYATIEKHIFVVDGSGSMGGTPIEKARESMQKLAEKLFQRGDLISVVVTRGSCTNTPSQSLYFNNIRDLVKEINTIKSDDGDSIPKGFRYAQEEMIKNAPDIGHIYLFGDGDGVDDCKGMKSIANEYKSNGLLAPFTYVGLDWTEEEKNRWDKLLQENGGVAYDYKDPLSMKKLSSSVKKKKSLKKKPIYFKKVEYLDKQGNTITKKDYSISPWFCVKSDGLIWYVTPKSEQKTTYIINNEVGKSNCKINCSPQQKYKELGKVSLCGQKDWRIPDIDELGRVASIKKNKLDNLFPNIRYWPHISSSGGSFSFNKGINFESSKIYDYKIDKPYSALFVAGEVNDFIVPEEMLNTRVSEVLSNKSYILPKNRKPTPIVKNPITKKPSTVVNIAGIDVDFMEINSLLVSKHEITYELFEKYIGNIRLSECKNHYMNYTSYWNSPGYPILDKKIPVTCVTPKDILSFLEWANKNNYSGKKFTMITTHDWSKMTKSFIDSKNLCNYNLLDSLTIKKLGWKGFPSACNDDGYINPASIMALKDTNILVGLRGNVREFISDCSHNTSCNKYKISGGSWRSNNYFELIDAPTYPENDLGFRIKIK